MAKLSKVAVTQVDVKKFIMKHGVLMPNDQIILMEPLFVFKKVYVPLTDVGVLDENYNRSKDYLLNKANRYRKTYGSSYKTPAVASLIIPVGAYVNLPQFGDLKCRSNKAYVYSITRRSDLKNMEFAESGFSANFKYIPANAIGISENELIAAARDWGNTTKWSKLAEPALLKVPGFDTQTWTCSTGIHWFVHSSTAVNY